MTLLYVVILIRGDRLDVPVSVPDRSQASFDFARKEVEKKYPKSVWIGVY